MIEQGTRAIVPCSFPFIVNENKFDKCTDYLDSNGKIWCSTKTDPTTMKHVGGAGSWGFCTNEHCPTTEMRTEKTTTEATTSSPLGMNYGHTCVSLLFFRI